MFEIFLFLFEFLAISNPLVAYFDSGTCGSNGDDANWEWCDQDNGGPCQIYGSTSAAQCTSRIAKLQIIYGNENAVDTFTNPYVINGCSYAYYAIYDCTGNIFRTD